MSQPGSRTLTDILPRILGFIPLLVVILVVTLLLIYKPSGYQGVVAGFAFAYLIGGSLMYFALRRAIKKRKADKASAIGEKSAAAPTSQP
jgi:Na+-driven multidrug efflux pump